MTNDPYRGSADYRPPSVSSPSSEFCEVIPSRRSEQRRSHTRSSSVARSDRSPTRPDLAAQKAVNDAFDHVDKTETATAQHVDPALIAQITEQVRQQVIESLKTTSIQSNVDPSQFTASESTLNGQLNSNPGQVFPPARNVYTPPSPSKHDFAGYTSASPEFNQYDDLDGTDDTPTPRLEKTITSASMPATTGARPGSRPPPAPRMSTDGDATTIEKIWRPLFVDGQPTRRVGEFLRGLAQHIIEDYEPKMTLVITPTKMAKFYENVYLSDELYPWQNIFILPPQVLSKIFVDLKCEHHFVQDALDKAPYIPALTPNGFQTWITTLIQAYPDQEYRRMSKAVLDMPIGNADNPKERFPKELSRRLFPQAENLHVQQRCAAALSAEGRIPLPKNTAMPPPPPLNPTCANNVERERSPYANSVGSDTQAIESDHESLSIPIERERQPYVAREGGGRTYESDQASVVTSKSDTYDPRDYRDHRSKRNSVDYRDSRDNRDYRESRDYRGRRHSRSHSVTSQNMYSHAPPPPAAIPSRRRSRRESHRHRSPSFPRQHGGRSEGNVDNIPNSHYTSNISGAPSKYDDDNELRRYTSSNIEAKRTEWVRRQIEDESLNGPSHSSRPRGGSMSIGPGAACSYLPPPPANPPHHISHSSVSQQPISRGAPGYDDELYRGRGTSTSGVGVSAASAYGIYPNQYSSSQPVHRY